MKQDVTVELAGGKQIKFETGRMAKQASGAAFTTSGDNAILATAVASPDPKASSPMPADASPAASSSAKDGLPKRKC
jgi:polyribonucleotide nucleotidyltransferase